METSNQINLKIIDRRGLIVWMHSLKQLRQLRKIGYIHYVSKKHKYAVVYVNETDCASAIERLKKFHFVQRVEASYRPDINMNFANRLGNQPADRPDDGYDVLERQATITLIETV